MHTLRKERGGDLSKQFASFCFTQTLLCLGSGVLCLLLSEMALLFNPFQRSCVRLKERAHTRARSRERAKQ
ncbi:MAG: hypothetical protein ACK55Z_09225, partial [bacterium]